MIISSYSWKHSIEEQGVYGGGTRPFGVLYQRSLHRNSDLATSTMLYPAPLRLDSNGGLKLYLFAGGAREQVLSGDNAQLIYGLINKIPMGSGEVTVEDIDTLGNRNRVYDQQDLHVDFYEVIKKVPAQEPLSSEEAEITDAIAKNLQNFSPVSVEPLRLDRPDMRSNRAT